MDAIAGGGEGGGDGGFRGFVDSILLPKATLVVVPDNTPVEFELSALTAVPVVDAKLVVLLAKALFTAPLL